MQSWWSNTYNRPLKDPMLEKYTLFELLYEYNDKNERELAAELNLEVEADKIEEEKMDETLAWIEEEERKEAEAAKEATVNTDNENDEAWMLEQLKKEHGEDFGDDIDISFSD